MRLFNGLEHLCSGVGLIPGKAFKLRFDVADDAIRHALARVHAQRHFGEFVLNHAERGNGRAERLAFFRVLDRDRQIVTAAALREGAELQAAEVQNVERDDVAGARFRRVHFRPALSRCRRRRRWWNCP